MNGTRKDIDPTTELVEEDEEQTLPEQESAIDLAAVAGPVATGQLASGRAVITAMPSTRRRRPASIA